jgi:Fe-S oxidoreductase
LLDLVLTEVDACRDEIDHVFPKMNRGLTGYNLQGVRPADGGASLIPLLCGSEGSLAVTTRIVVRLTPRPRHRALAAVRYRDFDGALRDVARLLEADPSAIEVIDDRILTLARQDVVWAAVEQALGSAEEVAGLSFVEVLADDAAGLRARLDGLRDLVSTDAPPSQIDCRIVEDPAVIAQFWTLRAKAVGLLGRMEGRRKGQAFVEDCAVPPERLADFVAEFRAILDGHGLAYGMFGHADVGCLHVRPALDMADPADAALIRPISDAVADLTRRYGGLIWGEHGRGFRGEFSPEFFGPVLYPALQRIKSAFDPLGLLNPGKIVAPVGKAVTRIDAPNLRGDRDRAIPVSARIGFEKALNCNGNAACFNWDPADPMCPSWKATRDRRQSPKGRAALLRDWMAKADAPQTDRAEVEAALDASLATCLSCKACSSQCPVQVDIPTLKARYLHQRHRNRPRSARDRLLARFETVLPLARRASGPANAMLGLAPVRQIFARTFGLVDLPPVQPPRLKVERFRPSRIRRLSAADRSRAVILAEDGFTSTFDGAARDAVARLLRHLGYRVFAAPAVANGKALHVRGQLDRFARIATRARRRQAVLVAAGLPIIGVEAATSLMFAQEYRADGEPASAPLGLEQFLAAEFESGRLRPPGVGASRPASVLLHCTERTARPRSGADWKTVFSAFGLEADTPAAGCCGMAGLFGHEAEHQTMSRDLFDMSWRTPLSATDRRVAATGFSCRCQAKRFTGERPPHPAEILLDALEGRDAA